jgi:hypothetical protein
MCFPMCIVYYTCQVSVHTYDRYQMMLLNISVSLRARAMEQRLYLVNRFKGNKTVAIY